MKVPFCTIEGCTVIADTAHTRLCRVHYNEYKRRLYRENQRGIRPKKKPQAYTLTKAQKFTCQELLQSCGLEQNWRTG
jgi:hypothetical protein